MRTIQAGETNALRKTIVFPVVQDSTNQDAATGITTSSSGFTMYIVIDGIATQITSGDEWTSFAQVRPGYYKTVLSDANVNTEGQHGQLIIDADGIEKAVSIEWETVRYDPVANSLGAEAISAATFAADTDIYNAFAECVVGDTEDTWIVRVTKNGSPVAWSGLTTPTLAVREASATGTAKFTNKTLVRIASTNDMVFKTSTAGERISTKTGYVAQFTATIDGASRSPVTSVSFKY